MPYRSNSVTSENMPAQEQFTPAPLTGVDISTSAATIAAYTNATGKRLELWVKLSLSALQAIETELDITVTTSGGNPPLNVWLDYKDDTLTTHEIRVSSLLISLEDGETATITALSNQTNAAVDIAAVWTRS